MKSRLIQLVALLSLVTFSINATAFEQSHPKASSNPLGQQSTGTYSGTTDSQMANLPESGTSQVNAISSGSAGGIGFPKTVKQINDRVDECQAEYKTAKGACTDANSTAGMNGSDKQQLMMGLAMVAQVGAQIAAAKGSAMACTLGAGLATTLQGLSMLKGGTCGKTRKACSNDCSTLQDDLRQTFRWADQQIVQSPPPPNVAELQSIRSAADTASYDVRGYLNRCDGYAANETSMAAQMAMLAGNAAQMAQCGNQTSDSPSSLAGMTPPNPSALASAAGDCSDPSFAATSIVCLCKSNPSDPMCANGTAGAGAATSGGLATGGVSTPGIGDPSNGDGTAVDTTPVGSKPQTGLAGGGGNGAGGGGPGGGGGGGLNPEGGDGTGASGINKDVITGQSGAGSGGLSAAGGGGGGGSMGRAGGGSGGGGSGFNLSKYLPKNMFKNRGLAGMTVPAQDGVTGPLGPSIWEKVHTRYEDKKSTLILDK